MPLEFIDLNTPPIVKVISNNRKVMGGKNSTQWGFKNQKIDDREFRKNTMTNGNQIWNQLRVRT